MFEIWRQVKDKRSNTSFAKARGAWQCVELKSSWCPLNHTPSKRSLFRRWCIPSISGNWSGVSIKKASPFLMSVHGADGQSSSRKEVRADIMHVALAPPKLLGLPFTKWSLAKLSEHLIRIGIVKSISLETLRAILKEQKVHLQRTKTTERIERSRVQSKKNA